MIKAKLSLTRMESESELWQKLDGYITGRLEVMRKQNDGDLSAEETLKLRGKIAFAKEILGLPSKGD